MRGAEEIEGVTEDMGTEKRLEEDINEKWKRKRSDRGQIERGRASSPLQRAHM